MAAERPTPAQLAAATGKRIADLVDTDLDVLFCGINPGLYSGAVGYHFARPGNRFWKVLEASQFTPRLLAPHEQDQLLTYGLGITNLVARTTATAAELTTDELRRGAAGLASKIVRLRPKALAVLGIGAYRSAFGRRPVIGEQREHQIGATRVWVLPNPSGLQARYQLPELTEIFATLRRATISGT